MIAQGGGKEGRTSNWMDKKEEGTIRSRIRYRKSEWEIDEGGCKGGREYIKGWE